MTRSRLAILLSYSFASVIFPVLLLVALNQYTGQMLTSWIKNNVEVKILGCLVYVIVQVFVVFPIMGSWATAVRSQSKSILPAEDLRKRLLSLNNGRLPFIVAQDPADQNKMTASWKIADEKWIELFAARGLTMQYQLRIKLVERKAIAKAQDNYRKFEYVGEAGRKEFRLRYIFSFFKGISLFRYERGLHYGVVFKDGKIKIDYAYNYKFKLDEIRNPIVEIITVSGWEFRPVVFL